MFRYDGMVQVECFYCEQYTDHNLYVISRWDKLWECAECGLQETFKALGAPDPILDELRDAVAQAINAVR